MNALLFDERLADALDDGNARRGWMMDLQRERSERLDFKIAMAQAVSESFDLGSHSLDCEVCRT